jgi:hypothetical protein
MKSEVATVQADAKVKPATRVGGDGDDNTDYNNSLSHRSDASTTSFAFPMYGLSAFHPSRFTIYKFSKFELFHHGIINGVFSHMR